MQLAATFAVLVTDVPASAVALDQVVELLDEVVNDQIRLLRSAQHSCVPVFTACFNLVQARLSCSSVFTQPTGTHVTLEKTSGNFTCAEGALLEWFCRFSKAGHLLEIKRF